MAKHFVEVEKLDKTASALSRLDPDFNNVQKWIDEVSIARMETLIYDWCWEKYQRSFSQ